MQPDYKVIIAETKHELEETKASLQLYKGVARARVLRKIKDLEYQVKDLRTLAIIAEVARK